MANELSRFVDLADHLWNQYLDTGPGGMANIDFLELKLAHEAVAKTVQSEELTEALEVILQLSRRCVNDPQGLCFLSGEAGLVPRPDLYRKFEQALDLVRQDAR